MDKLTQESTANAARPVPVQGQLYQPRLGDLVLFYDKKGHPFKGTVRWTGKHQGVDAVGIESVS